MPKHYDHVEVERRWQHAWQRDQIWRIPDDASADATYVLDMFPYPSAQGLHVGHPEGYTASDIYARYLRAHGKSVLHPMGFDSFGLPAENYAIKTGTHPAKTTADNIANMRRQIQSLGFSYDWSREVITSDPKYYRWTQWIFVQLYKHGLAYEADAPINWCPKDKTGLANEEVVDGKCERCGTPVTKKRIKQWLVKITDERYIERLLNGLDTVDWPESIKLLQRNWIGRSEGAEIDFAVTPRLPKKVVILHGYQGDPDTGWKAWLIPLLQKAGVEVQAPRLPGDAHPNLATHIKILEDIGIDHDTVLIGHSLGCVTAMEYVQKKKTPIAHLVLVAPPYPAAHPAGVPPYPTGVSQYSRWNFDFSGIKRLASQITILADLKDDKVPLPEPRALAEKLNARLIEEVAPRPHFANRKLGPYESWTILNTVAPGINQSLRVFTTRPDTIFGATYVVLSPEHPLVDSITTDKQRSAVDKYKKEAATKSDLERTDLAKDKTGVFTGAYVTNPVTQKKIPIWIADYVLSTYGTGAIMAVPAHDERDHAFARKFKLAIVPVIQPERVMPKMQPPMGSAGAWGTLDSDIEYTCWTGDGEMINSGEYDGMDSVEFKKKIIGWLEKNGLGKQSINYKMRDWLFSRQRYWGEPIPIIHCGKCGTVAVPEKDLPVTLPDVKKYEPTGTGESPLAAIESWVHTTCPECGGPAKRETNTMPQWAGSNWYFLRYCDPHNDKQLADPEKLKTWLPVDMYVGGAEHAVLHLLYARFIYKFLFDIGAVPKECGEEPFVKLKNQGIILGEDGQKMSKSRGNVINPDDVVKEYGADVLRMYEMFMGPFEDAKPWSTKGIIGIRRFVERIWEMAGRVEQGQTEVGSALLHQTIQSVTEKIELYRFNTCISDLMKLTNEWGAGSIARSSFEKFLQLFAPFAPHLAQELWHQLGHTTYIENEGWPKFDPAKIVKTEVTYAIQVNGKLRDTIVMPIDATQDTVVEQAIKSVAVQRHLTGEPKKVIFVSKKLVNFVV